MKKIITAIDNPKLNEELKKEKNFQIIGKDIQYKEAILEILEENNDIDIIILSEKIPGEIKLEKLIETIKLINEQIKIIFILEKENNELENILIKNNIIDIYYNSKINLKELIKIINKKEMNMEEEIIKLKKIIQEKDRKYYEAENNNLQPDNRIKDKYLNILKNQIIKMKKAKKTRNMSTKIVTFSGNYKSGKSTLSLIISQYLCNENNKVLLIDGDFEKQDLSIILKKERIKRNKKEKNKINKINNSFKILINKKNSIYYYQIKNIINLFTNKINKNLYFFNGLYYLLKNKTNQKEKTIKKIIFIYLKMIKKNYNFIIIDLSKTNLNIINELFLINSNINFVLLEANLLGVKEIQSSLKNYKNKWNINEDSLYILSNKKNINSINKSLISKSVSLKNPIYEIKENKIIYSIINNYFKKKFLLKNKKLKKEINKIIYHIIMK